MRVIPPNYYTGIIPEGYTKSDFFRFDETSDGVYGVLYSGDKVDVNETKPAPSFLGKLWANIKTTFKL